MHDALELLAWMVANQYLQIKVVVPFDSSQQPVSAVNSMYHPKKGLVEDNAGDRIAWNGSLNETEAGLQRNWEEISVFTEWENKLHFDGVSNALNRMWNGSRQGQGYNWLSFNIPEALARNLLQYLPQDNKLPNRLDKSPSRTAKESKGILGPNRNSTDLTKRWRACRRRNCERCAMETSNANFFAFVQ